MSRIGVVGAGSFGTALTIALAEAGRDVTLWARDAEHVTDMMAARCNTRRLPGPVFPASLTVTADLSDLSGSDAVLLSLPMQQLEPFLGRNRDVFDGVPLVACCKGVSLQSGNGPTAIIDQACPNSTSAILTGPSFAADIGRGLPTALTLASADAEAGEILQSLLSTPVLRLYRSTDPIGAELGGALKNVVAIAAGIVIGAGLGDSARAALMTRGFAEMRRFAEHSGAAPDTLSGLCGLGDLVLTCTSEQSRNFRYGMALGQGDAFDPAVTVEGASTARAVAHLAAQRSIDMPIATMVAAVLDQNLSVADAVQALMNRPLKEE